MSRDSSKPNCSFNVQEVVVDAKAHMLGRLASVVAKQALSGNHVVRYRVLIGNFRLRAGCVLAKKYYLCKIWVQCSTDRERIRSSFAGCGPSKTSPLGRAAGLSEFGMC
jgi:hypothetical protein